MTPHRTTHVHTHDSDEDCDECEEPKKKPINWAGVAALIAALTAVPGVLVNTYLDYRERSTAALVQRSSYENLASTVEEMSGNIKSYSDEVIALKLEIAELKGYLRGVRRSGGRVPAALAVPAPLDESDSGEEKEFDKKPKKAAKPPSFDSIMQHVQSTGEVYIQPKE